MNGKARIWMGVVAFVLLSTFTIVPSTEGKEDPCNACGATCMMEYKTGANDCTGSGGCVRITICP